MSTKYEFDVTMACGGCANTVKKAVLSLPNIKLVEASVENQKVYITIEEGTHKAEDLELAITNAGKKVTGCRKATGNTEELLS